MTPFPSTGLRHHLWLHQVSDCPVSGDSAGQTGMLPTLCQRKQHTTSFQQQETAREGQTPTAQLRLMVSVEILPREPEGAWRKP